MDYSPSPSPPSPASILVRELETGHRAALLLRRRLTPTPSSPPSAVPEEAVADSDYDLAEVILKSFTHSLSIASSSDGLLFSRFSDPGAGEGGESSRIKDRRGCYKRKRGETRTWEGEAPAEDVYAWRKYGQKMILNSKFPRNYFRCTHKTDQGCQAQKQVQKIADDPPRYRTTYNGIHTCKNSLRTPQTIVPSFSPDRSDSSILLSFGGSSNAPAANPFFPPSNSMAIKQEHGTLSISTPIPTITTTPPQAMMAMMMVNHSSSSDYNCLSSPDPTTLSGGPTTGLSTPAGSEHGGDVLSAGAYSCSASPHSLEMDNYVIMGTDDLDLSQFDCDM